MKRIFLFTVFAFLFSSAFSQWEYKFFSVRAGINHNFLSPKPGEHEYKFQKSPIGDMKFKVDDSYFFYGASYYADLLFHYDFENDKIGFVSGVRYENNSFGTRYVSDFDNYEVVQKFKINSVGVPLFIKLGGDIYTQMSYFYAGAKINMNMGLTEVEKASWTDQNYVVKADKNKLKVYNISYFVGYNYWMFHVEFGFMPDTYLDTDYTVTEDGFSYQPFADQNKNMFYFQTGINIPISEWLMSKSWTLEKIRRKFKRIY